MKNKTEEEILILKEIARERAKEWYLNNKEKIKTRKKEYNEKNKDKIKEDYKKWAKLNKVKIKNNTKKYAKNNREKLNEESRNYRKDNPDKIYERTKFWRENNPEKVKETQRLYYQKIKHIRAWRAVLHNTLTRLGREKEGHTIDLLGYSAMELKEYITKLFTDGMTWDNYGEWHIDHIKPVSSFANDTPINEVNALPNLQPLWATTREINGVTYLGNLNKGY